MTAGRPLVGVVMTASRYCPGHGLAVTGCSRGSVQAGVELGRDRWWGFSVDEVRPAFLLVHSKSSQSSPGAAEQMVTQNDVRESICETTRL